MQHGTFYFGVEISNLWVNGFRSTTTHDLILVALIVAAICFIKTALSALLAIFFDRTSLYKRKNSLSMGAWLACHLLHTLAITVDYALGYLLMFAFMICNVWLCITIIVTSTLSYFLTHWSRIRLQRRKGVVNRRSEGEPGANQKAAEETTILLQSDHQNPTAQGSDARRPDPLDDPSNRQTIVVASPGAPLVSFNNLYDRPTDIAAMREVVTAPPDVISAPVSPVSQFTAGPSLSAAEEVETKPRSDSNSLLEKYPLLKFHNVDVPDTSPSHRAQERGLQMQELDKLIHELQS